MAGRRCSSSTVASAAARVESRLTTIVANPTAPLDGCAEQGIEDETEDAGEEDDGAEGGSAACVRQATPAMTSAAVQPARVPA